MKRLLLLQLAIISVLTIKAIEPSGTLPAIYITTENSAEITSTETYSEATFYIDAKSSGYASTGTETSQVAMKIRGRGNSSWTNYDKKPYRVKLTAGQKLLGMSKSKNFALMAYADDEHAFLRATTGNKISQLMSLAYTPDRRAVELVLNGDYKGLYFLTETVRVDKDRCAESNWNFGPVWDFANALRRTEQNFLYQDSPFTPQHWIAEVVKFPAFQARVKELWNDFYNNQYPTIGAHIDSFITSISGATGNDAQRWPSYGTSSPTTTATQFKALLDARVKWLNEQFTSSGITDTESSITDAPAEYYNLQGMKVSVPGKGNVYIKVQGNNAEKSHTKQQGNPHGIYGRTN